MRDDNGQDPSTETNSQNRDRRPSDECFSLFGRELWGRRYAPGDDLVRRAEIRAQNLRSLVYIIVGLGGGTTVLQVLGVG